MRLGLRLGRAGVRQGRCVRVLRGLRPDRNPLRPKSDRVQAYLLGGAFVVAVAVSPFAARVASHGAYAEALRVEKAQLAGTHQVRAKLTQVAQRQVDMNVVSTEVPVPAAWTSAAGVRRSGLVLAAPGTPAGTVVTVWTNAAGDLTGPPLQPSQVTGQANMAGAGAIIGVGLLYLCGAVIVRYLLHRRRMAAWDADWVVTAQAWNRQSW